MELREIIELKSGKTIISESLYNNTGEDFKGVSAVDATKRVWMPPFSLGGGLLREGECFSIIPDCEFVDSFRPEGKFYGKSFTIEYDGYLRVYREV